MAAVDGVDTTFFPADPAADTDGDGLPEFLRHQRGRPARGGRGRAAAPGGRRPRFARPTRRCAHSCKARPPRTISTRSHAGGLAFGQPRSLHRDADRRRRCRRELGVRQGVFQADLRRAGRRANCTRRHRHRRRGRGVRPERRSGFPFKVSKAGRHGEIRAKSRRRSSGSDRRIPAS